jgi:hypothetical protein
MPKARRKPHKPTIPPAWADGPRQNDRAEYEITEGIAANGARIVKRHWRDPLDTNGPYRLTHRQSEAGKKLRDLWCITQRGRNEAKGERVDAIPDWDGIAVDTAQALADLAALARHIPFGCHHAVEAVCYHNDRTLAGHHVAQLKIALDVLANEVGL